MRRTSTPRVLGVLASLALGLSLVGGPAEAIKGGSTATDGALPSMAAVLLDDGGGVTFGCGGVLIGPRTVLTAAHCVSSGGVAHSAGGVWVGLGENNLPQLDADEIYGVAAVSLNPSYDHENPYINDVAVLTLTRAGSQSANGGPVEPATLVAPGSYSLWDEGSTASVAGWGVTESGVPSDLLRVGSSTIGSDAACGTSTDSTVFCTSGGAQTCEGDSGGPLFVPDASDHLVLAGIAVAGAACDSSGPDYFARLGEDPLATWVRQALDTTGPRAVGASPTGRRVKRSASVTVTFSEAVEKSTVAGQAITLSRLTAKGPVRVPGKLKVSADGLRATFNPFGGGKKVLAGGAHYRVVAGSGIQDVLGNPFDQKPSKQGNQLKKWEFTTKR